MGKLRDDRAKIEFGDFQTPVELAAAVCKRLSASGLSPRSIVEPTCGVGNLLFAALSTFPNCQTALGTDINADYVRQARARLGSHEGNVRVMIESSDFFNRDWSTEISQLPTPLLFIGNPPWVTNSDLGSLRSKNLPAKANDQKMKGLDALTGKSNFDISEWMLCRLFTWLDGRRATVAMLCKSAVARKALVFGWTAKLRIQSASICRIDSAKHFKAAVDACLLIVDLGTTASATACPIYPDLESTTPDSVFALRDNMLVADVSLYDRRKGLIGDSRNMWRSGIKHDCASLMEMVASDGHYENGDGELLDLEERFLYPMLKSSDIARKGVPSPRRKMLVTQTFVGEDTHQIEQVAVKTWNYLHRHRDRLARRASSIYKGKPAFSIFGVGDYTFAPWKVAISGLYKRLEFKVIGPHDGKPVVLDDTCYFLACKTEEEARFLAKLLASPAAQEFFTAFVFWDAKRPITADILRRLDFKRLAALLGLASEYEQHCMSAPLPAVPRQGQLELLSNVVPAISRRRLVPAAKRISGSRSESS